MEKFKPFQSQAVPVPIKDIDTDMIIPAQFMTSISRAGFGQHLFSRLRAADPQFPTNLERFKGAQILVADSNFGCGSSREHAVWALMDWGIRAVISQSFADIFYSNAGKNGLLLATLPAAAVNHLLETAAGGDLVLGVDLEKQEISEPDGRRHSFEFDPFRKHCLMNGLDDIDYILSHRAEIDAYRRRREAFRFFSSTQGNR